ncbi:MAG: response regulator [Halothece sp.]
MIAKPFNANKFLILVVDDVIKNIQVISRMLQRVGYQVTFATSGEEALQRLEMVKPDLILLDLMMPKMDGLEVCSRLKADPENSEIPIIFLTASHEENDLTEAFERGAVDYITKPFRTSEILARIRTHLELKETRDDLKRTLVELVEARNIALEKAQQKSQFIANVSHEIRTPMNGVLGMTEILERTHLSSDQLDCVSTIKASGQTLLTLINDILDYSKLEAGAMPLNHHVFNLYSLIQELVYLFTPQCQRKNIDIISSLAPNVPKLLIGDSIRLRQILLNLIGNAVKFTSQGEVVLKVQVKPQLEPKINPKKFASNSEEKTPKVKLYFSVSDTGIGIAPEDKGKLFQSFSQINSSLIYSYGGTGLGLAICQKLVSLMGGAIDCDSILGKGTTFSFSVLLEPVEDEESVEFPSLEIPSVSDQTVTQNEKLTTPNDSLKSLKVLVVEDTPTNQKVILHLLKFLKIEADCVNHGQEALKQLAKCDYDLIFMDCQMPILDGYQTTQKIRQLRQKESPIIIGLTAYGMASDRQKCLDSGMDDYLCKPISLDDISAILEKWSSPDRKLRETSKQYTSAPLPYTQSSNIKTKPIVDLEFLDRIISGDREFQKELLKIFVEDTTIYLSEAKAAVQETNNLSLLGKIHVIKGSATNLGIRIMKEVANKIEIQALDNNWTEIEQNICVLEKLVKEVEIFMNQNF